MDVCEQDLERFEALSLPDRRLLPRSELGMVETSLTHLEFVHFGTPVQPVQQLLEPTAVEEQAVTRDGIN